MPVVVCKRCNGRFKAHARAVKKQEYFPICSKCRCQISKVGDRKYMCIGTNSRGDPCGLIKMHGKDTCKHHENQSVLSSDKQDAKD